MSNDEDTMLIHDLDFTINGGVDFDEMETVIVEGISKLIDSIKNKPKSLKNDK